MNRRDTYQRPEFIWTGWHTATVIAGFILALATVAMVVTW